MLYMDMLGIVSDWVGGLGSESKYLCQQDGLLIL